MTTALLIDGELVPGEGPLLAVENPATEEVFAQLPQASAGQFEQAVAAARRAFESGVWRDAELRRSVLLRLAELVEQHDAAFRSLLVQESGTPIALCQGLHVGGPVNMMRHFAERTVVDRTRALGQDPRTPPSESLVRYEPVGVVGGIVAYNSPLLFLVSKAVAALAAGCTSVYTPSPLTPLATLMFGELALGAGVPPGVLNIVVGGVDLARSLTTHPGIRAGTQGRRARTRRQVGRDRPAGRGPREDLPAAARALPAQFGAGLPVAHASARPRIAPRRFRRCRARGL
jgi:acyl-CoA reductase-like NAD-dependent aldehyde dehydrogenase